MCTIGITDGGIMDIKQLTIFLTVCDFMNFTETAKHLNYAQSTVSETISNLEKSLKLNLFERIGNKIYLTVDGERLKSKGSELLNLYEETMSEMKKDSHVTIRIGIIETLCSYKFPGFFKLFLEKNPHIHIEFKIVRCEDFLELIRSNQIDIGFTLDEVMSIDDIETISLFDEEIVFIAPPKTVTLDQENIIVPHGDTGYMKYFHDVYRRLDYKKGSVMYIESIEGIKSYVINNFGISFIPLTTVSKEIEEGSIDIIRPNKERYFHEVRIIHHKNKHITESLERLIAEAVKTYQQ